MNSSSFPSEFRKMLALFLLTGVLLLVAAAAFAQGASARANNTNSAGSVALAPDGSGFQEPPAALAIQATRTPRPTATPVIVPPPADPTSSNLMIVFAGLIVVVILLGVWINRRRV
jgi:hypothetical protein